MATRSTAGASAQPAASGDGFSTPSHASDAIHDFLRAVSYVEGAEPHPPIIELDKNGERV
jgi:hypothetical protein